eukprot:IDg1799t1
MYLGLSEQIERNSPREVESKFKLLFDKPEIPPNVVLDFETSETSEGRLLATLMSLSHSDGRRGVSALGAQGMGGVGKTTALRALCYEKQVIEKFIHGVCFLEFGQDATDGKFIGEVKRCIENLGGKTEEAITVDQAVKVASRWLCDKSVLVVCDDLWPHDDSEKGYLPKMQDILRNAPKSALLISTRDRKIARRVGKSVEFDCLEQRGTKARDIFMKAAFTTEDVDLQDLSREVDKILDWC